LQANVCFKTNKAFWTYLDFMGDIHAAIPEELIVYCFCFLNLNELVPLSLTCKSLQRLVNDNYVWKSLYGRRWGFKTEDSSEDINWRGMYLSRKDHWKLAIPLFNNDDTIEGMKMLIQEGKVKPNPNDIATFLRCTPELDKKKIGFLLGEVDMVERGVLKAFMNTFQFENLSIDEAFRYLLTTLALPTSAKKIQMLTVYFSDRFYECNSLSIFVSADQVFTLIYSMLMLNTDLHNGNVKRKIPVSSFVTSIQEMKENATLSREFIEQLYYSIQDKPLTDARFLKSNHSTSKSWKSKLFSLWN